MVFQRKALWVSLAAASLLVACGGGGADTSPVAPIKTVKVMGDSIADSGTFGFKFTVQGSAPTGPASTPTWPELVASNYGSTLCPRYVSTGSAFNNAAGCTNYAVGGGRINNFTAPASPVSIVKQLIDAGADQPLQHTLLEMWTEILSNLETEAASKVSPQVALGVLGKWAFLEAKDVTRYQNLYFERLSDYRDILHKVVEANPGCLLRVEKDAEENRDLYIEIVGRWQGYQAQVEELWAIDNEDAMVELAAFADAANFMISAVGLVGHLEQLGINPTADELDRIEALRNGGGDE